MDVDVLDEDELRLSLRPMLAEEEAIILRRFEVSVSDDTNDEANDDEVDDDADDGWAWLLLLLLLLVLLLLLLPVADETDDERLPASRCLCDSLAFSSASARSAG